MLAAVMAAAMLLTVLGPQVLRHGAAADRGAVEHGRAGRACSASPSSPGNATVAKGGDELIEAQPARLPVGSRRAARAQRRLGELDAPADDGRQRRARSRSACSTSARRRSTPSRRTACARTMYTIDVVEPAVRASRSISSIDIRRTRSSRRTTSTAPATSRRSRARWCAFASRRPCRRPAAASIVDGGDTLKLVPDGRRPA